MRPPRSPGLIAYASVHGGKSLLWAGEDMLSLYILICLVKMEPGAAGLVFLLASFWNAALDSLWGASIGRFERLRRFLPGICAIAALLACLAFSALPLLPPGSAMSGVATILLFRTAFSLFDVPHNGITTAMADRHGHLPIARLRAIGSSAASVAIGLVAIPLLASRGGNSHGAALVMSAVGIIALLLISPLPWLLRETAGPARIRPVAGKAGLSRAIIGYCMMCILGFAALEAMAKALLHVQGPSSRAIELVPLILAGGRLGAVWLWSPIARRFGNAMALRIAFGACGLAALPIPAAIAFGDGAELAVLLLLGWAMGGVGLLCWARLSELSAESAGAGNPAAGMMHYAFFTTATKLGLGLSGVVVGLWLASAGATHVLPVRLWTVILLVMLVSAAIAIGGGRRIPLRDDRRSTRGPSYPASAPG